MKLKTIARVFAGVSLILAIAGLAAAQKDDYRLSRAFTHKNLTIFLIHGKDQNTKGNIITLQEAMEKPSSR